MKRNEKFTEISENVKKFENIENPTKVVDTLEKLILMTNSSKLERSEYKEMMFIILDSIRVKEEFHFSWNQTQKLGESSPFTQNRPIFYKMISKNSCTLTTTTGKIKESVHDEIFNWILSAFLSSIKK